jgi:hypothetical protein
MTVNEWISCIEAQLCTVSKNYVLNEQYGGKINRRLKLQKELDKLEITLFLLENYSESCVTLCKLEKLIEETHGL